MIVYYSIEGINADSLEYEQDGKTPISKDTTIDQLSLLISDKQMLNKSPYGISLYIGAKPLISHMGLTLKQYGVYGRTNLKLKVKLWPRKFQILVDGAPTYQSLDLSIKDKKYLTIDVSVQTSVLDLKATILKKCDVINKFWNFFKIYIGTKEIIDNMFIGDYNINPEDTLKIW